MKCLLVGAIAPPLGDRISPGCLPFGAMALSGFLKAKGVDCEVISTALPNAAREIKDRLAHIDLLGISSMSGPYLEYGISVAKAAKRLRPDLPIVWGGPHASLMGEDLIRNKLADYVIRGAGEKPLLALITAIEGNLAFASVPALSWTEGGLLKESPQDNSFDINELPQMDYSVVSLKYPHLLKEDFAYFSSRGCPYDCSYCVASQLYNRRWHNKSEDRVVEELAQDYEKYQFKAVFFWDDNLFVDSNRLKRILDRLQERGIQFNWAGFCRADLLTRLDENLLLQFKKNGLRWMSIGAESGSDTVLKQLEKGIKVEDILEAAHKLKRCGISCDFSFMAGIPGESKEDFYKTLAVVRKIKSIIPDASVRVFKFIPYPKMPILEKTKDAARFLPSDAFGWGKVTYQTKNFPWVPREIHSALTILSAASAYSLRPRGFSLKNLIMGALYYINQFRLKMNFFYFPLEAVLVERLYGKLTQRVLGNFTKELNDR
ncbi:MAG: radical SAM protein [Candidatus Omnitrophica bacterium]|nr:radical SAM protein [Candidatus Omnitrophota bacterium]